MTTLALSPFTGRSALPFIDAQHPDRPLTVHCYRPDSHRPENPVVIVQHGMLRNGDEYRDFWIPAAEKHGLLIAAPTFSDAAFPGTEAYNNGLVVAADGSITPQAQWAYAVPARVLDALRAGGATTRQQAMLYGHSAGGQFAHRLLATQDHAPFAAVIAANPGWYTLPDLSRRFPEGLGGTGFDDARLAEWFRYPMQIFAGDQDIEENDPNLPAQPEALAQGPHRYARAKFMFLSARTQAAALGMAFNWTLTEVPGVGHDGEAMSRAAAAFWFEGGRIPPAEELVSGAVGQL